MGALTDAISQVRAAKGGTVEWEKSARRYIADEEDMPDHDVHAPLWPVILTQHPNSIIEDGWHRLHDYYRKGVATVPVVWEADPPVPPSR